MATETIPPGNQKMVRNDEEDDTSSLSIETLSEMYFEQARAIENEFTGSGKKGFCFGLCSLSWCPRPREGFESVYRNDPDRCSTYGLAIRKSDELVVGVMCLRQGGQNSTFEENLIHKPKGNEMYIDHIAVTKASRGMGAGTKLLHWAEEKARERNATVMSLGVVKGNPAKSLYLRFGFTDVGGECFFSSFMMGRPHGRFGCDMMEKPLIPSEDGTH